MFCLSTKGVVLHRIGMRFAVCLAPLLLCLVVLTSPARADRDLPEATIVEVNDGDTVVIMMADHSYRTRLIGIDAPEMGQEPWGKKAKKHLREIVSTFGRRVRVETDVTKYDKYDRLLAYLWLDDGTMINERMLKDGFAVLFTIQPNSNYVERLRRAQSSARENHSGIWGPKGLTERPIDYKRSHPKK